MIEQHILLTLRGNKKKRLVLFCVPDMARDAEVMINRGHALVMIDGGEVIYDDTFARKSLVDYQDAQGRSVSKIIQEHAIAHPDEVITVWVAPAKGFVRFSWDCEGGTKVRVDGPHLPVEDTTQG